MTKKKKNYALWTVICLVSILAVGTIAVIAFSGSATTVIENAGGVTINNPVQPVEEQSFGSVTSSQALDAMVCSADLCTYTATGSFADATTTIVSISDPFLMSTTSPAQVVINGTTENGVGYTGATSTIDIAILNITTAATSTYGITCGVSAGPNAAATNPLITTGAQIVSTSSVGMIVNNFDGDSAGFTSGAVAKVMFTPNYPYFNCIVATTGYDSTFTSASNAFDGKFSVRISRPR